MAVAWWAVSQSGSIGPLCIYSSRNFGRLSVLVHSTQLSGEFCLRKFASRQESSPLAWIRSPDFLSEDYLCEIEGVGGFEPPSRDLVSRLLPFT